MGGILEMQGATYNGMPRDGRYLVFAGAKNKVCPRNGLFLGDTGSNFDTDIHSCLSYKSRTQDKNTRVSEV